MICDDHHQRKGCLWNKHWQRHARHMFDIVKQSVMQHLLVVFLVMSRRLSLVVILSWCKCSLCLMSLTQMTDWRALIQESCRTNGSCHHNTLYMNYVTWYTVQHVRPFSHKMGNDIWYGWSLYLILLAFWLSRQEEKESTPEPHLSMSRNWRSHAVIEVFCIIRAPDVHFVLFERREKRISGSALQSCCIFYSQMKRTSVCMKRTVLCLMCAKD
jgi:hypothetical protein